MRRRTFLATVGAAGGGVLAGCGDPGEATDSPATGTRQQAGGDGRTGTPDAASTPDEPPTPDETTTPEETTTETTETETGTSTGETSTEGTPTPDEASGAEEGSMEYPSEYVDVRDVEYDANEDADRGPTVTGVVQNVSTEELSLVEAKVWAYDEDDEEVGEALDDTTDLKPGETWECECELWDTDAEEVDSWKGRVDVSTY
jgi:hypothetical protein